MYHQRLKHFILFCIAAMLVCLLRLWYLQIVKEDFARQQLEQIRVLAPKALPTLRGKIIDRNEHVVACDEPFFYLQINYELTRLLDPRFWEGKSAGQTRSGNSAEDEKNLIKPYQTDLDTLKKAMDFCIYTAGMPRAELNAAMEEINDRIWELGRFICWRRNNPDAPTSLYDQQKESLPAKDIIAVDLQEMHKGYSVLELFDQSLLVAAQVEFASIKGAAIQAEARRVYPFGSSACHLIGWVGPVHRDEADSLFSDDAYLQYLDGEAIGKYGLEKVCEAILRGKRGEVTYDRQKNEIARTNPQFGRDVQITLDMNLQQQIEKLLSDPNTTAPGFGGTGKLAAVVIEPAGGDILAMVSVPGFDLNQARREYGDLLSSPDQPLRNRAMEETYPPGSSIKPLILLAGLEEHKITADEVISCSFTLPPANWPKCLLQRKNYCHDARWQEEGQVNNGRNALRGSCNVFFSRLADRLEGSDLQRWLWQFGWGTDVLAPCISDAAAIQLNLDVNLSRQLRQAPGNLIDTGIQKQPVTDPATIDPISPSEKRWWGIGQGSIRVTALQVANAYAALSRHGLYKPARLVIDPNDPMNEQHNRTIPLHTESLKTVYDGMHAVVNEDGGSAYEAFSGSGLKDKGMTIYGKTGSTERPFHAWFASFATDLAGRAIVIAVVAEGGQSGAKDAAPFGREIYRLCNQAGFIGTRSSTPSTDGNEIAK